MFLNEFLKVVRHKSKTPPSCFCAFREAEVYGYLSYKRRRGALSALGG